MPLSIVESEVLPQTSWARVGTVIACGGALFADGYVNAAGGASRYILKAAFVGIVIGQLSFSIFASCWIMFFSILSGLAYGGDNPATLWRCLIAYRFLIGIGIGAEYPAGSVAASENTEDPGVSKKWQQGLLAASTNMAIDFGFVAAYLVPYFSLMIFGEGRLEWVWRLTLGFGAVSAFVVLLFRMNMAEPKLYRENSMKAIPIRQLPWLLIFKRYWSRLLGMCVAWAVYDWVVYPAGIYSSTIVDIIIPNGSMLQNLGWDAVINAFYLPGSILGALAVDRIGPKYTMIIGFVCQAIIGYVSLQKHVAGFAVVYGIYLSFGEFGPGNCTGVMATKATGPTAVRGIFYGIAAATGKIFAFIATYVYTGKRQPHTSVVQQVSDLPDACADIINDFGGAGTTKGDTGPVYIGSGLCLFAAIIVFFLLPNIDADFMSREDELFRVYLEENGYDTSLMGLKPLMSDPEHATGVSTALESVEKTPVASARVAEVEEDRKEI
ncbi:hypothetical protein RQP46_007934 [Phenoliferia psychrophenolica]